MEPERHLLLECDGCHIVYGRASVDGTPECRVCGGTAFTYIRNVRHEEG